jgi:hypothetical protein
VTEGAAFQVFQRMDDAFLERGEKLVDAIDRDVHGCS